MEQEKNVSSSSWQAVPPQAGQACANPHTTWAASSQVKDESGRYVDKQDEQRSKSPLIWTHDAHAWPSESHGWSSQVALRRATKSTRRTRKSLFGATNDGTCRDMFNFSLLGESINRIPLAERFLDEQESEEEARRYR
jgi:hypothetical protein